MSLHNGALAIYYTDAMSPPDVASFSQSPTKPRRFMDFLRTTPVWPHVVVKPPGAPLTRAELLTAHTLAYVDAFLEGAPRHLAESNSIRWTRGFRDSVLWTNASLCAAVRGAISNPATIAMSPSSGFHHAGPGGGQGFCTFSGQVIAALDVYRSHGKVGAWIDLDGHFGNSIPDSASFVPEIKKAIRYNLNPSGDGTAYLENLSDKLVVLERAILAGEVDYVAVAHGADSHEWDAMHGQLSTDQWLAAADMVYACLAFLGHKLGRPIPVVLSLFGGYRDDHPESVLGLHAMDTALALNRLAGVSELLGYRAEVRKP